jgi:enoyl-CoA hydratase/carnithine racemase
MTHYQHLLVEEDGPLLVVSLNRPSVLNALNAEAHGEMAEVFDYFSAQASLRVAILTAVGERAFCVGTDLKSRHQAGSDVYPASGFGGITHRHDLYKPVIAAVNGLALGGGVELVLACDCCVASDQATFGFPETRVGLAAVGGAGIHRLVRKVAHNHAMWLLLTGESIDAAEAARIGLINTAVPAAEVMKTAHRWAQAILRGAPIATAATKQVALRSLELPDIESALKAEYPLLEEMLHSEDALEGSRAFTEKRKPRWKGS